MFIEAHCSVRHVLDIPVHCSVDSSACDEDSDGSHLEKAWSNPRWVFGKFPNGLGNMPGTVRVSVLAARDLPVMDRASELTDAFVEVREYTLCSAVHEY